MTVVAKRRRLTIGALLIALSRAAIAQSPVRTSPNPVGIWRGTSVCLVHPSACNDEIVVYRITPMKSPDSLAIDARKLVSGAEVDMGVLGCRLVSPSGEIACTMPQGVWHWRVHNDGLTGELRLPDNTRYREVRATRVP